jgi:hypothetical protein
LFLFEKASYLCWHHFKADGTKQLQMYSKAQASQLKQNFWTAFGLYLSPHFSSEGERINWVNYHTGYKHLYFKMEADQKKAYIGIELHHQDILLRELYFDKFSSFRSLLENSLDEEWTWEQEFRGDGGKVISRIYKEQQGLSVFDQTDWPGIISFLKPRIIALDEFWNMAKDGFEELR